MGVVHDDGFFLVDISFHSPGNANLDGEKEQVDRILENAKYCERVVTYSSTYTS